MPGGSLKLQMRRKQNRCVQQALQDYGCRRLMPALHLHGAMLCMDKRLDCAGVAALSITNTAADPAPFACTVADPCDHKGC